MSYYYCYYHYWLLLFHARREKKKRNATKSTDTQLSYAMFTKFDFVFILAELEELVGHTNRASHARRTRRKMTRLVQFLPSRPFSFA